MKHNISIIENGIVCRMPYRIFSYFAWPSVACADDGTLMVACSGLRTAHVDPFGKVVMYKSTDNGKTWSGPHLLIDTPLDDRDAGIVNIGNSEFIVTSFNNTRKQQYEWADAGWAYTKEIGAMCRGYLDNVTDDMEERYLGSLVIKSSDNGHTWSDVYKVPVSAPHGPTLRRDGTLLYAGTPLCAEEQLSTGTQLSSGTQLSTGTQLCADTPSCTDKQLCADTPSCTDTRLCEMNPSGERPILIYTSSDGLNYARLCDIPACDDPRAAGMQHSEPHILELKNGRIVLHIRIESGDAHFGGRLFSLCQSVSDDGGKSFSVPKLLENNGAPPHLMQHSSGTVVCSYGRRIPPYGISAMLSSDNCDTWDMEHAIWANGISGDLGYPCSVELPGGDIFTAYYAALPGDGHKCSILWTRWRIGA